LKRRVGQIAAPDAFDQNAEFAIQGGSFVIHKPVFLGGASL
jgi:hypothetical protein